jgi:hypothetical protein
MLSLALESPNLNRSCIQNIQIVNLLVAILVKCLILVQNINQFLIQANVGAKNRELAIVYHQVTKYMRIYHTTQQYSINLIYYRMQQV